MSVPTVRPVFHYRAWPSGSRNGGGGEGLTCNLKADQRIPSEYSSNLWMGVRRVLRMNTEAGYGKYQGREAPRGR